MMDFFIPLIGLLIGGMIMGLSMSWLIKKDIHKEIEFIKDLINGLYHKTNLLTRRIVLLEIIENRKCISGFSKEEEKTFEYLVEKMEKSEEIPWFSFEFPEDKKRFIEYLRNKNGREFIFSEDKFKLIEEMTTLWYCIEASKKIF